MFGIDCISRCSGNCLNNVSCNSTNGHCDSGCASGYLDVFCNKSMHILIKLFCIHLIKLTVTFTNVLIQKRK